LGADKGRAAARIGDDQLRRPVRWRQPTGELWNRACRAVEPCSLSVGWALSGWGAGAAVKGDRLGRLPHGRRVRPGGTLAPSFRVTPTPHGRPKNRRSTVLHGRL